jgi:hypothetical protein
MSAGQCALWLRTATSTDHLALTDLIPGRAPSRFLLPQSCSSSSHRAVREATTTTSMDLRYLLAPHPHVQSSDMTCTKYTLSQRRWRGEAAKDIGLLMLPTPAA